MSEIEIQLSRSYALVVRRDYLGSMPCLQLVLSFIGPDDGGRPIRGSVRFAVSKLHEVISAMQAVASTIEDEGGEYTDAWR